MNNKKAFLVIMLAAILAFFAVQLVINKSTKPTKIETVSDTIQQEESIIESPFNKNNNTDIEATTPLEKTTIKTEEKENNKISNIEKNIKAPVITPLRVEEATIVVEEEQKIPDIYSDENGIVITRAFKVKSPTKYSFRDFGILDEVSAK